MAFGLGNLVNGLSGNLTSIAPDKLTAEYGNYLIENEHIESGYKLIRDAIIFTNIRIIFVDKQGATGKKTALKSIFLMSIINVDMETAGSGIEDSQLTVTYLENAYLRTHAQTSAKHTFEFPKSFDLAPLYTYLFNLAYQNRIAINK